MVKVDAAVPSSEVSSKGRRPFRSESCPPTKMNPSLTSLKPINAASCLESSPLNPDCANTSSK